MGVLLLHCGKSRPDKGGGGWEKQISKVGGSTPINKQISYNLQIYNDLIDLDANFI
jgi:hypothetical protein